MKEFRIRKAAGEIPRGVYALLCDDGNCMNRKAPNSNYCHLHARDERCYLVERKVLWFWMKATSHTHAELSAAESEMIALADGKQSSVVSTWRLRDDGILEQIS